MPPTTDIPQGPRALLGRMLCMAWVICAAVNMTR